MSCLSCEATFEDMNSLRLHCLLQNHLHFLYTCGSCNAAFVSLDAMKSHMALHGLSTTTEPEIDITMHKQAVVTELASPSAQKTFKCLLCGLAFDTKTQRKSHKKATHEIKCQYCEKGFYKQKGLEDHAWFVHQVIINPSSIQKTFKCSHCELVFDTKTLRKSHKKATHKIKCQHCKKGFYKQGKLDNHVQRVHQMAVNPSSDIQPPSSSTELRGDLNFKCQYCDQVFPNREQELKTHRNTHRIWNCYSCTARFFVEDRLIKHVQRVHPHIIQDLEQPEANATLLLTQTLSSIHDVDI